MHDRMRLVPVGCLALTLFAAALARSHAAPPKEAEYKPADSNFYFYRDVHLSDPDAPVLPETSFRQQDGSWFLTPHHKAPRFVYVRELADWLEPVTPPSMPLTPEGLGIAPDEMQIREPQGDVTVALPASPSNFVPATNRMTIPDGATVKTGGDGTAAILLGGINSLRLAPNSQASVEQTVTPEMRSTRIDLKSGAAFSKVGLRPGVPGAAQDFQVRTAFGTVKVKGTDFLTVIGADHTNVFLVKGVVEFDGPDGHRLALAKSDGTGEPQIIQSELAASGGRGAPPPVIGETTMAFDFIPSVNVKVKALRFKEASGEKLTAAEKQYLSLLRRVPVLIKLARVQPDATMAVPAAPAPQMEPAMSPIPPTSAPQPPAAVVETPPAAPKPASPKKAKVAAKVTPKPLEETTPAAPPEAATTTTTAGQLVTPVDLGVPTTTTTPARKPAAKVASAKTAASAVNVPAPRAVSSRPLNATLHADNTVTFRGHTVPAADFEANLKQIMATKPHKTLLLRAANDVPYADIKDLIAAGKDAGLQDVKLVPDTKKTSSETADATPSHAVSPAPLATPSLAPSMKAQAIMAPRAAAPSAETVPDAPAEANAAPSTSSSAAGPISPSNGTVP